MKLFLNLFFICLCLQAHTQASSSSSFSFTVVFDRQVSVMNILPAYYEQRGNYFSEIHFNRNVQENSITISGYNHFILYVSFPTVVFFEYDQYGDTQLLKQSYYVVSLNSLTTYPLERTYVFKMNKRRPYIVNSDNRRESVHYVLKTKRKRKMPPYKETDSVVLPIEEAR